MNQEKLFLKLESLITHDTKLVGSSLGGYFASYLSQQLELPAVVINPAVAPFNLMQDYLGEQYNPHQNYTYQVTYEHIEQLKQLYQPTLWQPKLIMLLQQMGDEVLDFSEAVDYYKNSHQFIEFAGDHSFIGFERYFSKIAAFFKLTKNLKQ